MHVTAHSLLMIAVKIKAHRYTGIVYLVSTATAVLQP